MKTVRYDLDIERLKREHCNHKCLGCKHRLVYAYEDDTPAGRTPYHFWEAKCTKLNITIRDNEIPPVDCDTGLSKAGSFEYTLPAMAGSA